MLSTPLAERSPELGLITAVRYFGLQFTTDGMSGGKAKRDGESAAMLQLEPELPMPFPAKALSSLEALPWMTQSDPSLIAGRDDADPHQSGNRRFLLLTGLAAALAALYGGTWYLDGGTSLQLAAEVKQDDLLKGSTLAKPYTAAKARIPDTAAAVGQSATDGSAPAEARPTLAASQTSSEARAEPQSGAARPKPIAADPVAAPTSAGQAAKTDAAAIIDPSPPPGADGPATATTLKEYRSTIEECRDAIRDTIRLGDRQRPGRNASAEEQTSYRLRQQNAEAAKAYRSYLDTLARSMRGTVSETAARQSLDRARQTLGYVNTMLADARASLR